MAKKTRPRVWYFAPKDDHTNEVLSRILPAENFRTDLRHSITGRIVPVWECDSSMKGNVSRSIRQAQLDVDLYNPSRRGFISPANYALGRARKKPKRPKAA